MISGYLTTHLAQFSILISALVTVSGWFIVSGQADKREFRKEVREHLKSVIDRSDRIIGHAAQYWLQTGPDANVAAMSLKMELSALARQIQTLSVLGLPMDPALMAEVRLTATGGTFEQKDRVYDLDADRKRLVDLSGAIEDLLSAADEAFYLRFRPIKRRRLHRLAPFSGLLVLSSDHHVP